MQRSQIREAAAATGWLILSNAILGVAGASAQDIEVGKMEYQSSCAACHGAGAKGDGPVSKELRTRPADLTVLAKNNNGMFPYEKVYQMIDGRNTTIASHGLVRCQCGDIDSDPPQAFRFNHRIVSVIDYLKTVQAFLMDWTSLEAKEFSRD